MKRGLAILGSTGSIGTQTLQIVRAFPDRFSVLSLTAGRNLSLLKKQIEEFHPLYVAIADENQLPELRQAFPGLALGAGPSGIERAMDVPDLDTVVVGIVGFAALAPALYSLKRARCVALANKECLVVAGQLFMDAARKSAAHLIPVDSEHNAVFQVLEGRSPEQVRNIVLTASGGPLFRRPELSLDEVTPEIATNHPNWKMGPKISVDSALMLNKGLEVIEAHYLFGMPSEKIDVWVHPQSIVHGAVQLIDGTLLPLLTKPDMRSSIGYALAHPERLNQLIPFLDPREMSKLEFYEPDLKRFPALRVCREALAAGPGSLVVLNAAAEIAVGAFLERKLSFSRIVPALEGTLERMPSSAPQDLAAVFSLDEAAREAARQVVNAAFFSGA